MYVSECFWPKDLSFDRSRKKSQIVKSALRCFPIVLRLGTTPTTGAADNPLNIYPDISSAVAAAHLSNLSIINIIITIIIIIVVNIILIETRNIGIVCTEVHHPSTPVDYKVIVFPFMIQEQLITSSFCKMGVPFLFSHLQSLSGRRIRQNANILEG